MRTFLAAGLWVGLFLSSITRADDAPSPVHLENALVVPHGNTISCYGVPVAGAGETKNYDVEINLSLGADGTVHAEATRTTPSAAPVDTIYHFQPGEYVTVPNRGGTLTVSGPVAASGGRQIWTYIAVNVGIAGLTALNGTWMTGPVEGNPQLDTLPKGATLPKNFTFGRDDQQNLVGVQQLGDKLVIASIRPMRGSDPERYVVVGSCILQMKPPPSP